MLLNCINSNITDARLVKLQTKTKPLKTNWTDLSKYLTAIYCKLLNQNCLFVMLIRVYQEDFIRNTVVFNFTLMMSYLMSCLLCSTGTDVLSPSLPRLLPQSIPKNFTHIVYGKWNKGSFSDLAFIKSYHRFREGNVWRPVLWICMWILGV